MSNGISVIAHPHHAEAAEAALADLLEQLVAADARAKPLGNRREPMLILPHGGTQQTGRAQVAAAARRKWRATRRASGRILHDVWQFGILIHGVNLQLEI